jgi:hypothetical protein
MDGRRRRRPSFFIYNLTPMRLATMVRIFFVIYCFEAGFLLVVAPWHPLWDATVAQISLAALRNFFLHPLMRGAVSGFGLVHIVWGLHDAMVLTTRRSRDAPDVSDSGSEL